MKTKYLKDRLAALGKSTEWLAEQCGISPVTLKKNIMNGLIPSRPILILMAQALRCNVSDIVNVGGDEDHSPEAA